MSECASRYGDVVLRINVNYIFGHFVQICIYIYIYLDDKKEKTNQFGGRCSWDYSDSISEIIVRRKCSENAHIYRTDLFLNVHRTCTRSCILYYIYTGVVKICTTSHFGNSERIKRAAVYASVVHYV